MAVAAERRAVSGSLAAACQRELAWRRRARLVSTHPSADRPAPGEKDFYRLSAIFSSLTRKLVCKGDLSG